MIDTNGPTQMVTQIVHKPEFTSEGTVAVFDEIIEELQHKGVEPEELDPVKVKFRSDFYSMLESGMGSHMPRFGLMHYLACFTLFDGDPDRINTILDGFLAVTPERSAGGREEISRAAESRRADTPARKSPLAFESARRQWRRAMTSSATSVSHATAAPALAPERPVAWPKRTVRVLAEWPASRPRRSAHVPEHFREASISAAATP